MYWLAKLHPNLVNVKGGERYKKSLFANQREKKRAILEFYANREVIPLCIDHCGAETCGFVVPQQERIGTVRDLFNNAPGEMVMVLHLDGAHPAFKQINRGLFMHKQRWGVSVWIDLYESGRKKLTHVALTTDPHFARYGTWLDKWAVEEWAIDSEVARHHFQRDRGLCYAAPEFVKKMTGI